MAKDNRKKVPDNISGTFKKIVRRKQNRKDGKKVYYYYNATDNKRSKKSDWQRNENLKSKLKLVYGKGWKDKFNEYVKEIKAEEKKQRAKDKFRTKENISAYLQKEGYPFIIAKYINGSGISKFEEEVIEKNYFLIIKDGVKRLITKKNLHDLRSFCSELLDWYFDMVKELYTSGQMSSNSPFLMFPFYVESSGLLPDIKSCDIDGITGGEDFPTDFSETKNKKEGFKSLSKKINELYNVYLSETKKVDVIEFIYKLRRK